jgi:hypothetical protein
MNFTNFSASNWTEMKIENVPPLIIFEAKNSWDAWTKDGPPDASYNASSNGWMEESIFYSWLKDVFILNARKYVKESEPVVLILDGHSSHLSFNLNLNLNF